MLTCLNLPPIPSTVAGANYEAFNKECCFDAGSSLADCKVPLINNDVCGEDDRQFTCQMAPTGDQMACEDVANVTIKDDDGEWSVRCIQCKYITIVPFNEIIRR